MHGLVVVAVARRVAAGAGAERDGTRSRGRAPRGDLAADFNCELVNSSG